MLSKSHWATRLQGGGGGTKPRVAGSAYGILCPGLAQSVLAQFVLLVCCPSPGQDCQIAHRHSGDISVLKSKQALVCAQIPAWGNPSY